MTSRFITVIRKVALPLYFGVGLVFAGLAYGESFRYRDCPVFDYLFIPHGAAEGIMVATLFWPAILIAGADATCHRR
jgi:hypothetical protein